MVEAGRPLRQMWWHGWIMVAAWLRHGTALPARKDLLKILIEGLEDRLRPPRQAMRDGDERAAG